VESTTSETIFVYLPGQNEQEVLIFNTHTDGPNACEENGAIGLLALARYFSRMPLEQRARGMVFVFVTGHFQLPQFGVAGQATSGWLRSHPEYWDPCTGKRAVAGLTLEHLGAMQWRDDRRHAAFLPTGRIERELIYTGNTAMAQVYRAASRSRSKSRMVLLKPGLMYFGEGEPLFNAGIPTLSLVPAPDYLCAVPADGGMDKLDMELLEQQIRTFALAAEILLPMPTAAIGQNDSQGLLARLVNHKK
jgi:hypothetical protein